MKIQITFKSPDALVYAAENNLGNSQFRKWLADNGYIDSPDETWGLMTGAENALANSTADFIEHGEYLTVEFDLETKTARVMKKGE